MNFGSFITNHNPMKDLELPNCPDDSISMIKFSPNANYLLSSSWDNSVRCWEVAETGPVLKAQIAHDAPVLACCWHSVGLSLQYRATGYWVTNSQDPQEGVIACLVIFSLS